MRATPMPMDFKCCNMKKEVIIIGGGIIGFSTAYYLVRAGCSVTLIDKNSSAIGASYVNAGYLTPSHIVHLRHPGWWPKG